jgi:NAD(P)-dependent dehydrogenase (short-subunit alcohol dehydrogenase family)
MIDFEGRTILVTGALGILGSAMTARLAGLGARVLAADLPRLVAAAEPPADPRVRLVPIDLSDPDDVERFAAETVREHGALDGIVNNAASKGSDVGRFMRDAFGIDRATWEEVSAVNVDGAFFLTRALARPMIERGAGSIVFIGSIYGGMAPDPRIYEGSSYLGGPIATPPVYAATKAALSGLTRYLAAYWGASGVRVNCLCPGGVDSGQNETFRLRYSHRVPLGRMAEPTDIADPVAFLLSDAARYMTGQTIYVDGGLSIW